MDDLPLARLIDAMSETIQSHADQLTRSTKRSATAITASTWPAASPRSRPEAADRGPAGWVRRCRRWADDERGRRRMRPLFGPLLMAMGRPPRKAPRARRR